MDIPIDTQKARLGRELRVMKVKDAIGMMSADDLIETVRNGVREFYAPDRAEEVLERIGRPL